VVSRLDFDSVFFYNETITFLTIQRYFEYFNSKFVRVVYGSKQLIMISKSRIKFIKSLQNKKVRDEERLFVIEGDKLVREFLSANVPVKILLGKPEFLDGLLPELTSSVNVIEDISYDELKQISALKTPHNALAVVHMPEHDMKISKIINQICVALDFIQDPGNLGTIIRAAGWFGIKNIVCSPDCVDVYNPKVIQASMGALLQVNVFYSDLKKIFTTAAQNDIPVFGTLLEGESIYDHKLDNKGIILLGNESKGISNELIPFITEKIRIPKFSKSLEGIDSLNVGMAASIVFSEFLRKSDCVPD
jgi:TrmH family RNA methyltransferase